MGKVKAAKQPAGYRLGGKVYGEISNTDSIIAQHDAACTAMALFTNALADMAAATEDPQLVKVALYANRTTREWHRLGDILLTMLRLAIATAGQVGEP